MAASKCSFAAARLPSKPISDGYVFLPLPASLFVCLPSCSGVDVTSRTSSTIWKAIPNCCPYVVTAAKAAASALALMAPSRQLAVSSAPVFSR
jgi:hypothetical protein